MQQPGHGPQGLVHVKIKVSGVIYAPLSVVWGVVRSFANVSTWLLPVNGSAVRSELMVGLRCQVYGVFPQRNGTSVLR